VPTTVIEADDPAPKGEDLKRETRDQLLLTMLARSPLLAGALKHPDFAQAIMSRLRFESFSKGSVLCRVGVSKYTYIYI